jgi:hypothetical protein
MIQGLHHGFPSVLGRVIISSSMICGSALTNHFSRGFSSEKYHGIPWYPDINHEVRSKLLGFSKRFSSTATKELLRSFPALKQSGQVEVGERDLGVHG